MNDVETRLRDALAARAATVTHEPDAYGAVVARRARRSERRLRALGVATAAAAAVAVAGVVVVARPARHPDVPPATPAPAPAAPAPTTWMTVIEGDVAIWQRGFADPPGYGVRPLRYRVAAVAAFGDSRQFVYSSRHERRCASVLNRGTPLPKRQNGMSGFDVAGPEIAGEVTAMAVSPDRRRLAYLMHPAERGAGGCAEDVVELRIRDLQTGREQVWREPAAPSPLSSFVVTMPWSVGWSATGRYVSAGASFEIVDTAVADRALRRVGDEPIFVGDHLCHLQDRTFRGRTGDLVGYLFCPGSPHTGVHVLDGDRPVRLLIQAPSDSHYPNSGIRFDRSGDHAFLLLSAESGQDGLYRWDADTGLRRVDTGAREIEGIDW